MLKRTGIKDNHAYTFAVHDKAAAFDKEHRNIHCHLMFNEKIIEKDRPLGPELYFRRYSVNRAGELSGGYKISRQYQSKADILQLRKTWAEIVNAKFAEKNLSECHIDERTLKAQHDDLIEQGKTEDAALLNRNPAPHLGNAYLNPLVMERIKEIIKDVEEKHSEGEKVEVPIDTDDTEKKILLFAKDFLLRKLAKAIQKERQEALRDQKNNKDYSEKQYQADKAVAYVITSSDLSEQVNLLIETTNQVVDSYKEQLADYDKKMLSKKQIHQQAYELLFNNEYAATNTAYAKMREKITALSADKKAFDNAVINNQAYDKDAYAATLKELNNLYTEQRILGQKIGEFKAAMATDVWKNKKQRIIDALTKRNKAYYLERRKTYGLMLSAKKKLDRYNNLKTGLDSLAADTVIYAEKVPNMVNKYTMIEGTISVNSLPKYTYDNQTYCVLSTEIKEGRKVAKAVRLYDNVSKGKAPVYELSLGKQFSMLDYDLSIKANDVSMSKSIELADIKVHKAEDYVLSTSDDSVNVTANKYDLSKRKSANQLVVLQVDKTNEVIATYAQNKSKQVTTAQSTSKAIYPQYYRDKACELISKLTESKEVNIPVYWQDDNQKPMDKLQITEMQMYSGWSL